MIEHAEWTRQLTRSTAHLITEQPPTPEGSECGWYSATRDLARGLCETLGGGAWEAHAVEPRHWMSGLDRVTEQVVMIDDLFLIVVSHLNAASRADRFRVTVNGQPIAHRPRRGVMPWAPAAIAHSVFLHTRLIEPDPCDALTCREAPVFTLLSGSAYCAEHVDLYR